MLVGSRLGAALLRGGRLGFGVLRFFWGSALFFLRFRFVSHRFVRSLVNAGFGIGVALHPDGFARAFAGAGIGGGALASNGQAAQVTDAAVAFDALEAFEVQPQFAAQVTFNQIFAILDGMDDLGELLLIQIFGANASSDFGLLQNLERIGRTNAIDVTQSDINSLLARYFDSDDACHKSILSLPLFVAAVRANDANHAIALDDFAILAKFFYRCANFHN